MRIILVLFVVVSFSLQAQEAEKIVKHYIDTVSNGNIDNWKKIKSMYTESIGAYSQQNFTQDKKDFDVMPPNFTKVYVTMPDKTKIEIYEDSTCSMLLSKFYYIKDKMVIFMGNLPPVEKPNNGMDPYAFTPVLVRNLIKESKSIKLLGTKDFANDSITCYEIEVTTKTGLNKLYINTSTYLLEYWSKENKGALPSLERFSSYKKFGELLFPTKEVVSRNNIPFYWKHIRKLETNIPIDPKEFTYKMEPIR